jgi:CelD/BcsL family acetyltransferase involved in cellulose biosynthesis
VTDNSLAAPAPTPAQIDQAQQSVADLLRDAQTQTLYQALVAARAEVASLRQQLAELTEQLEAT